MKRTFTGMVIILLIICSILFLTIKPPIGNSQVIEEFIEAGTEEEAFFCAYQLYEKRKSEGMKFESQCLGVCGDYAVDIVHVPREKVDDKPENKCPSYIEGKVKHFIEFDQEGNLFRMF